ncbi:MAG: BMP family ABC transporter substrate-binding protein [Clostridiales bacterium]|nr:BMP family ABC transporter substrate-binding protein [Clostridiales bacterium]MDY2721919.1 BMP family ABC transporter substrate-binding protein [Eubacteriales bacterium]
MKKKILAIFLVVAMVAALAVGLTACKKDDGKTNNYPDIKIGMLCLHDKNSTYDKNFITAMEEVQRELGLRDDQVIIKTNIPEDDTCYQEAMNLVDAGCNIIFADSFGHEAYMLKAAKRAPKVLFAHATGTLAHTEKDTPNFVNAFASIYEGRFLAGVAAGLKLNEMAKGDVATAEEAKMGYVGAYPYAEVISGYTSFYLGAKSVCPNVTMDVTFTGSWYDETAEQNAANLLIGRGCKLISQHADSMGAPNACEKAGVPNVSYNGSTAEACPKTFIVSSRINWAPYYKYLAEQMQNAKGDVSKANVAKDWTGTLATGSVELTAFGKAAAAGTAEKVAEIKAKLEKGELHVFDTNNFTVNGKQLSADHKADVDTDAAFTPDTIVVENGVFFESKYRSAPYFDVKIDGITIIDKAA